MLRTQELVPDYYIEKSRDFQVLCRLFDFSLNALKYNIDSMQAITDTRRAKDTILPLIGDKFGIYEKNSYSNRYLLEALPIALKYKGSLKAVNILINAFLDSEDVFDYVTAFSSKDEESAKEISEILNRDVKPYSIVIFLSDYPNMTNLQILDEYLNMVIPSGIIIEYMFGINKRILEKFRYKEYVFLFFTNTTNINGTVVQDVSLVKSTGFDYIEITEEDFIGHESKYFLYNPIVHNYVRCQSGDIFDPYAEYFLLKADKYSGTVPEQYEDNAFVKKVMEDVDVNAVSIASISSAPVSSEENNSNNEVVGS